MRRALVMIAALIAFPGHAMPSYWTGKDLFEWCEAFGERTRKVL
jgi:hypothetical protein